MDPFRTGGAFESKVFADWAKDEAFLFSEGDRVGPFTVVEPIQRGGSGEVYVAERTKSGFVQTVALKVLSLDARSGPLVERFERERRILARLHHPSIAGLIDGGVTDEGAPYLAMELIQGSNIDAYCETTASSPSRKVELIVGVLEALQYAHGLLVVHRDIKPSNIKVAEVSGRPILLDFGIAKIVQGEEPLEPSQDTRTEHRMFTPRFASPEQRLGALTSVATDIYQVGLLLYFLLTGHHYASPDSATSSSNSGEPDLAPFHVWPSQRAETQLADERDLRRQVKEYLSGDLSAILFKALAWDPAKRYATAQAFAADLIAFLEGRPVRARSWTLRYRAGLWAKKHRSALAVGAAATTLLVGGLVQYVHQIDLARAEAEAEARRANEVTEYVTKVFAELDPFRQIDSASTLLELVRTSHEQIEQEMTDPLAWPLAARNLRVPPVTARNPG